ncbi:hypothetical protein P153DRAFT_378000 [Dothidotthia symphoricarpi CBS 119687]|uniref:25S rRNA (Uridine(2843)-N(3))-methyltransferase n=1 Tax=Dothidotthia symphoricarpi CBS 119687 TaxID=1392245 RepID=A0A6A6A3M4_9PLEO|nr:uncharacterized protein P153DRAFT_378000 [Dothidotthia symphoricarpi CBS 119687]KAF2126410.1 hypothetical protein P153DRAFT_378000 [Dothidotthia symphoricarpi CBS 119687]
MRWQGRKKPEAKASKDKQLKASERQAKAEGDITASSLPHELQQLLLNIFKDSFTERLQSDFTPLLQELKGHLFNRDFATAFGRNEYLDMYAARWSPSRALGYLDVLWDLKEHFHIDQHTATEGQEQTETESKNWKVVCLGGGAGAEIVALGGLKKLLSTADKGQPGAKQRTTEVIAIDIADWTSVVDNLADHVTTPPPLSKYASAAAQAANVALIDPSTFKVSPHQLDVLNTNSSALAPLLVDATLVTLMFTLNELYSTSLSLTQGFLLSLTTALPAGAMLLVVDSPGSYSTISLNGAEKKYPMHWLLDHTLLKEAEGRKKEDDNGEAAKWEKVHEDESRWFRLDPTLKYPIELENMRMQLHLYRRL